MFSKLKLAFLCLSCTSFLAAQNQTDESPEKWEPLMKSVQNILSGQIIQNDSIVISPSAYLIYGGIYENLKSILNGESEICSLIEGNSRDAVAIVLKINDSGNAAYLMLKTVSKENTEARFHTVIFMKDSRARWVINAWHTSS